MHCNHIIYHNDKVKASRLLEFRLYKDSPGAYYKCAYHAKVCINNYPDMYIVIAEIGE